MVILLSTGYVCTVLYRVISDGQAPTARDWVGLATCMTFIALSAASLASAFRGLRDKSGKL